MGGTQFKRDDANATLTIERTFAAPQDRVWRAMTDPGLLDRLAEDWPASSP